MKLFRAFLFLCMALLGALPAAGAAPLLLQAGPVGTSLGGTRHLQWLSDDTGQLSLEDVRSPAHADRFATAPPAALRDATQRAQWFRVEVEQREPGGDWLMATSTTALGDVRFYGPFDASGKALAAPVHTGQSQPYASRPLGSERIVMRLQLPQPGTYTVYARISSEAAPIMDMSVWETAQYLQWRQHKRLFDGICYGILLALLVYNTVLASVFRIPAYVYYLGQCVFALLTLAAYNGHAAHYLWGDWPWWQERGHVVLPGLWMLFGAQFARSFLETRQLPYLDRPLQAVSWIAAGSSLLGLAGWFGASQTINEILASVGSLFCIVAGVVVMRRGLAAARWYLGGQALLFLSALGVVLVNWQVLNAPWIVAYGLQSGVAAELVVFAIALSTRINGMRASQEALRLHADHLAEAAATDPLTGLANRAGLAQGAARMLNDGSPHALMLLDLDSFKPINDQYGHDVGDAVLVGVAHRLQDHMRAGDIVARLGGDEFVILIQSDMSQDGLSALAHRLGTAVRQPLDVDGRSLSVGVSTGIARCPQDGRSLTELMRCADRAMYLAKQTGSGHAFHRADTDPARVTP